MGNTSQNILIAALGGGIPALIWLMFWLREDRKHPEPPRLLIMTFVAGMIAVLPILELELMVSQNVPDATMRLVLWSSIEEVGKFLVAAAIVLWRKEVDEPIDYVVYLVTTALGFAAVENTLFILNPLSRGLPLQGLVTGNLRFIGAMLVHIVGSATVGISLALAYYKGRLQKLQYLTAGLILAVALHAAYNVTIIIGDGKNSLVVSSIVWIVVICLLVMFEEVKRIHPTKH